jgi:hypothetical protein
VKRRKKIKVKIKKPVERPIERISLRDMAQVELRLGASRRARFLLAFQVVWTLLQPDDLSLMEPVLERALGRHRFDKAIKEVMEIGS